MDEMLRDLYQELLLDHNKHPRNFHEMEEPTRIAHGWNPLCGDKITLFLHIQGGVIDDISFQGQGCAISTASASLLTEHLKGKTEEEARDIFSSLHAMLTLDAPPDEEKMGKLAVLGGVREFPVRVKCATLSWHVLKAALDGKEREVILSDEA